MNEPLYMKYLLREIPFLKKLFHPNIIRIENLKMTEHNFYIIMDYCNGGSLSDCLDRYKEKYHHSFIEEIVQNIARIIINCVKYIHSQRIIHRDLKLNNILVHFQNKNDYENIDIMKAQIKITDFKSSLNLDEYNKSLDISDIPDIYAPFLINHKRTNDFYYNEIVDIWSIGIICYQMLIGNPPFIANNIKETADKIKEGNIKIPTNLSKEVISFLNNILQYDAHKRLTAEILSELEFLTKNIKEFTKIKTNLSYEGQSNTNTKNEQFIFGINPIFKQNNQNNPKINLQNNNIQIYNNDEYQIKELKRQLNLEKNKNMNLIKENTELKNIINNLNNNIKTYENKMKVLENEIIKYQSNLNYLNAQISYSITAEKAGEKIIAVNFVSLGFQDIGHYCLPCKKTDIFVRLEEKLNNSFPQLKEHDTYFMVNGRKIKRFKTLDENNIKSNAERR